MPLRRATPKQVIISIVILLFNIFMPVSAKVSAQETENFAPGDIFAAIGDGKVGWYSSQGKLIKTLDTGLGGATTGMAFDKFSNLYVTNFDANSVSKFDTHGNLMGAFGSDFGDNPESIVFDKQGNVYVGHAGFGFSLLETPDVKLRKFDEVGNLIATYDLQTDERGSDWIDLDADQCTFFYTSEGRSVLRYNVCSSQQLSALTKGLHGESYALRILGDGGVLVADSADIHRLDSKGNIVTTYDVPGEDYWFALNRNPDGKSFWSGSLNTENIYKFDIVSGQVLMGPIHACDAETCLGGLAVYGELTEAITPGVTIPFSLPAIPWYLWLAPLALVPVVPLWLWLRNRSTRSRSGRRPNIRDDSLMTSGKSVKPETPSKPGADVHHGKNTPKR